VASERRKEIDYLFSIPIEHHRSSRKQMTWLGRSCMYFTAVGIEWNSSQIDIELAIECIRKACQYHIM
jgi:hypothetical protein